MFHSVHTFCEEYSRSQVENANSLGVLNIACHFKACELAHVKLSVHVLSLYSIECIGVTVCVVLRAELITRNRMFGSSPLMASL